MKKLLLFTVFILTTSIITIAQPSPNESFNAKEYSKELTQFFAKEFLINNVLNVGEEAVRYEVIPLAASSSGELTTMYYHCESQNKTGLILGFYGSYWNKAGVKYTGYKFKNLEKDQAIKFLNKIESVIEDNKKYLRGDLDNNNIAFQFDDMYILIWGATNTFGIRVFWGDFDATWQDVSYNRSKSRFHRNL